MDFVEGAKGHFFVDLGSAGPVLFAVLLAVPGSGFPGFPVLLLFAVAVAFFSYLLFQGSEGLFVLPVLQTGSPTLLAWMY